MQTVALATARSDAPAWWVRTRVLVVFWVLGGIGLMFAVGAPPVQRTQEARVLETAREMLGRGWRGWMLPQLNGRLRVRKPPLAYWMAAGAFEAGGVSEGVGRVPTVFLAWLTLGITFAFTRWLFNARAGFFAAGCLLCSYLFFRYTRLAETDAPAMFFVTLGIMAFWKAMRTPPPRSLLWFHVGAAGSALAVMSKGPPGAYPFLFLLAMVLWSGRWDALVWFLLSGALLTFVLLATPWFAYVLHTVGVEQWKRELDELGGEDHPGHFWQYFYELFVAVAPWCVLLPAALVAAVRTSAVRRGLASSSPADPRRRDRRVVGLLLWIAVILVPLCFVGNKQFHYLLPLMPPVMILIGWWIDLALQSSGRIIPIEATLAGSVLAAPAVLVTAKLLAGRIGPVDIGLAAGILVLLGIVATIYLRRGPAVGTAAYLAAVLLVFVPVVGIWMPLMEHDGSREVARRITHRFGSGPYCFYGPNYSLPLCFSLRSTVPQVHTAEQLEALAAREPGIVVIVQSKKNRANAQAPPVPRGFARQASIARPGQLFEIYQRD